MSIFWTMLLAQAAASSVSAETESERALRQEVHSYAECVRSSFIEQFRERNSRFELGKDLREQNRAVLSRMLTATAEETCSSNARRMKELSLEVHRVSHPRVTDENLREMSDRRINEFLDRTIRPINEQQLAELFSMLDGALPDAND